MRRSRKLAATLLTVVLLAMAATPALADSHLEVPEGFDSPAQCALGIAFVIADQDPGTVDEWLGTFLTETEAGSLQIIEGQEDAFAEEVAAYLEPLGLSFTEACATYAADVGGVVLTFELVGPEPVCELDLPHLEFETNVPVDDLTLVWVQVPAPEGEDADFSGRDSSGNEVTGLVRYTQTVEDLEPTDDGVEGRVLWPGMEVDEDGEPVAWPGWEPDVRDGVPVGWNRVDDHAFAWARTQSLGELGVVATSDTLSSPLHYVTYHDPDSECVDPPDTDAEDAEVLPQVITATDAGPSASQLPITGRDALMLAAIGVVLLLLGLLAVRRTHPVRSRGR